MILPGALRSKMVAHARACLPNEACGLVGGRGEEAVVFQPCVNVLASPTRYRIDPLEILRTLERFDREGLELVGIFHSHPATPAWPSATDVAEAYYPEAVYLIASLAQAPPALRGFRIVDGRVTEVRLADR